MKIIDAIWEKRNIGVDTLEITIEQQDTQEEVKKTLSENNAGYCVVKLPTSRADLLSVIQQAGYIFSEDVMHMVSNLEEIKRSPLEQRFYDSVSVDIMNEADIKQLKEEIMGGMFDSDRIYLDPFFTHEQASQRYVNWVDDELSKGCQLVKYIYKEKTIGFFGIREVRDKHFASFLGGIYPEFRKGGIGTVVKVPDFVKSLGGISVDTHVSTNNPAQIRNLIKNGYMPEGISHVFIKHNIDKN